MWSYLGIHSFIHSEDLYSAYSEALPAQPWTKKDLREMQNLEGWAISTERSSKGRSFHADGPTIEKALRCIIGKRARGTKNSPWQQNAAPDVQPEPTLGSRGRGGKRGRSQGYSLRSCEERAVYICPSTCHVPCFSTQLPLCYSFTNSPRGRECRLWTCGWVTCRCL